ncbi:MAG TPA: amidohydrolase [Anaeromyxobacteraceae bacterium]|nr:amidohydrolase [Anaeromyxobacteraceae bacterium]
MSVARPLGPLAALALALAAAALPAAAAAASPPPAGERPTDVYLEQTRGRWEEVARRIWGFAETALQEKRSAAYLEDLLEREGFQVTRGVGVLPTAFVASAGSGAPVVALLAEYDALPGLAQDAGVARKEAPAGGSPGHGCGHNLLGAAAVAAAVAANRERLAEKLPGTVRVFGTPAEEISAGKAFMIRDGAFRGTDVALAWHPEAENMLHDRTRLAITASDVEFFGRSAHASASPWLGRSALDALALFDHAMALMREHVKPTARIHRVVKDGGKVANVIPDYARGQYWLRDATVESVNEMLERMRKAADGAALATETRARVTVLSTTREPVPNDALSGVVQRELERVGPPAFDEKDEQFARALQRELGVPELGLSTKVVPYGPGRGSTASSDIGDVSAVVPLAELFVATRPLGTPAHQWSQTSCAAHPLGFKGMLVAARVLAASAVDLVRDPELVRTAQGELARNMEGKPYRSPLTADAKPVVY